MSHFLKKFVIELAENFQFWRLDWSILAILEMPMFTENGEF